MILKAEDALQARILSSANNSSSSGFARPSERRGFCTFYRDSAWKTRRRAASSERDKELSRRSLIFALGSGEGGEGGSERERKGGKNGTYDEGMSTGTKDQGDAKKKM